MSVRCGMRIAIVCRSKCMAAFEAEFNEGRAVLLRGQVTTTVERGRRWLQADVLAPARLRASWRR